MRIIPLSAGPWEFRDATAPTAWRSAAVPGCVHRDLLRHELIPDPFWGENEGQVQWIEERDWEYRLVFSVDAGVLAEDVVELVADGLDTVATVVVNDTRVAKVDNMFIGWRWPVKPLLRAGRNEIRIRFGNMPDHLRTTRATHQPREINDPVGRCTVVRKQQCQFGWDWGPRLVTAGIWRDVRLEAWSGNRLEDLRVIQDHRKNGEVVLRLEPTLVRPDADAVLNWRLLLGEVPVAAGQGNRIVVDEPQLWWPNGQGPQSLYLLEVEASSADGAPIGEWTRRIGLRKIELDRHADEWGESFQFRVNGRAVFAKGANWIPAHSFVAGLNRADYQRDLRAAVQANMNMVRVWGGGIYESEDFYDLCDELGLLVWQDFMFACTLYPADEEFVASVRAEAGFQVRRLRHRACLALWCGNNEVFGCNAHELKPDRKKYAEYERVFHQALPEEVAAADGVTPYWPSSPWRGDTDETHAAGVVRGDTHYWDVWHGRHPVKDYEKYPFRFASEFGMQSFPSAETLATFCPPDDANVFGPVMSNHQKNRLGNQVILDYVSRHYRFPKDQDSLLFLSQLNQAYCMQTGVEHYRRNMPRCMGALYWQLNDCWPVASWSSIEFTGRWRVLHHVARRFFAPLAVSAHVPGEEQTIINNYRRSTVREVHLYTVSDAPEAAAGVLRWDVLHLDGRGLQRGRRRVTLQPGQSVRQKTLDLGRLIAKHGRDNLVVRIALDSGGQTVSEETVFLAPPRLLNLPRGRIRVAVQAAGGRRWDLTFTSLVFQHRFTFDLAGLPHFAGDNCFELYPAEPKKVAVELERTATAAEVRAALRHRSLVDTY